MIWQNFIDSVIYSSAAIMEGTVYIGADDGNIYSYDLYSGSENWRLPTGGEVRTSPVVAGDQLVIGSYDGTVYGIDRFSGSVLWSQQVGASASTLVVGETVYAVSVDGRIVAITNA